MKKILYSFMLLFAATLCFTACSDDDDNGSIQMPEDPAANIAGTYQGTWTAENQKTGDVKTGEGTISLVKGDSPYIVTLNIDACSAASITAMSAETNVTWNTGNVYNFFNKLSTNALGTAFAGKVYDGTTMYLNFVKEVRSGRSVVTYNLTFNGTKQ